MAFSNRLGTSGSKLGHLVLGYILEGNLFEPNIDQTLNLTDIIDYDFIGSTPLNQNQRCVDDVLNISDTVTYDNSSKVYRIVIHDFLNLQQPCIVNQTAHLPRIISRTVNQTLTLTDRISNITGFLVNDSLNLNQTIVGTTGNIFNQSINDTLTLNQTLQTPQIADQIISDTLTLTDIITYTFLAFNVESFTDTIEFAENIVPILVHEQTIIQTLIFTNSNDIFKIFKYRLKDTLTLADTLTYPTILERSISDQLIFKDNYNYPLSYINILTIPTISYTHIPISNTPITPGRTKPDGRINKKYVQMSAKNGLILLPQPLFDDSHSATNAVQIARSMNGTLYSFVKRSKTKKLTYNFSLNRQKAQELGTFYLNNCHQQISLINHNGDQYLGFITSEPFVIAENRAYDNQVELTFEGVGI